MMSEVEYKDELYMLYKNVLDHVKRRPSTTEQWDLVGAVRELADFVIKHPKELEYVAVEEYYIISIAASYLKWRNNPSLEVHPEFQELKLKYQAYKSNTDKSIKK